MTSAVCRRLGTLCQASSGTSITATPTTSTSTKHWLQPTKDGDVKLPVIVLAIVAAGVEVS